MELDQSQVVVDCVSARVLCGCWVSLCTLCLSEMELDRYELCQQNDTGYQSVFFWVVGARCLLFVSTLPVKCSFVAMREECSF